jgi:(E)-4-hydroxy-3-methylbut-2-enyl-diphosphate synthase
MADADYGYVGTGPGKVNLYRGHEMVKQGIDEDEALNELIALITLDGKWIENTNQ